MRAEHDHFTERVFGLILVVILVSGPILGACGTRTCPAESAPMYVWYWPPLQCARLAP